MNLHPHVQKHYQPTYFRLLKLLPAHIRPTTIYNSSKQEHTDAVRSLIEIFQKDYDVPNLPEEVEGLFSPDYHLHEDFIAIYGVISRTTHSLIREAAYAKA